MSNVRVAVVSGAGRGIGEAIAESLGGAGYSVALVGRSAERLAAVAARLQAQGIRCAAFECDVGDWGAVERTVALVGSTLGVPTVLVNNAGGWLGDSVLNLDAKKFRGLVESCVLGVFNFSKAVVPGMQSAKNGFILNIGSTSALDSSVDTAGASAPKAAVRVFTHRLAAELAGFGIKVAILHPARVNKKLSPEIAEALDEASKYSRVSPRQIAAIALFMIEQPPNIVIRELTVTPRDVLI